MQLSSPQLEFDGRLLTVEEQFRQRKYRLALTELRQLDESEFVARPHEHGLLLLLLADACHFEGNYKESIERGLQAAKLLAGYPLNRQYGRVQLVLSKAYGALGDIKNAEMRAHGAVASYRRAGDQEGLTDSLNQLAGLHYIRCDYRASLDLLGEALVLVESNPRKLAQLTGNLGLTRMRTGQWELAEKDLRSALQYNRDNHMELSLVTNLMSLGMLQMRRRDFAECRRSFDSALDIINKLDLKRERVIYLEYSGELALEKGDNFRAKAILEEAYQRGTMLAPNSALVSQSGRRLAEAELTLDNVEDAMKYGQKALELSLALGERLETALAHRVIARVFVVRGDFEAAAEHIHQAVDILRDVGEPYELGRTLLVLADIRITAGSSDHGKTRSILDEAYRVFRRLKVEYAIAEVDYKAGVLACQRGDLASGFQRLNRAERVFQAHHDNVRVRAVGRFLRELSEQAVALAISDENEFKIFGNLISADEYSDLKSSRMDRILRVLLQKTAADRAIILVVGGETSQVVSSFPMDSHQEKGFAERFTRLLGQEVSVDRPTLILDCRRDPFVNGLVAENPDVVTSVIVAPFRLADKTLGYLYLDRLVHERGVRPFNQVELNFTVGFTDLVAFRWAEIEKSKLLQDNLRLRSQLMEHSAFPNIITKSADMLEMLNQARRVVDADISVAIEGETGTGKDLLARAIHYNSGRRDRRFVSVNCAALPETLLESELFGFKRGAFTGAERDKSGLFEEADGGTFFLDEIADMPLSIQAKVLRILEQKEIVRLGETVPRKVDVRIVSATNKDLRTQLQAGLFREDLYYRLCVMTFRIPPLRERKEDIPLLINHFLDGCGRQVATSLMRLLVAYDWPGNVRELENELKKMVLLAGDVREIGPEVVSRKIVAGASKAAVPIDSVKAGVPAPDIEFSDDYSLYDFLAAHERQFILRALKSKKGIKKHAAAALNIPESTLRLKIKQYNIDLNALSA